jgi:hypothetical protein
MGRSLILYNEMGLASEPLLVMYLITKYGYDVFEIAHRSDCTPALIPKDHLAL